MKEKAICGICQGGCHVIITKENGRLVKVERDPEDSKSRLCPRGALAPEILYSEQRIKTPMIRTGEKGEGEFRSATWEEAFEYAANKIKETARKYGEKSLASYFGRGVLNTPVFEYSNPFRKEPTFLRNLGSPNDMSCRSICFTASNQIAPELFFGVPAYMLQQDIEHCDLIFAWGKNAASDEGPQRMYKRVKAAKARGAKLIVIDPRKKGLGEIADIWVPVIPGSDGALALMMLKHVVSQGKYNKEFTDNYTVGFDELVNYLDTLDESRLSESCGVTIENAHKLADMFSDTNKATAIYYTGLEYQLSAVANLRAIYTLWAITGKIDVEGSMLLPARPQPVREEMTTPEEMLPIGAKEFPIYYHFTGEGMFSAFPDAVLKDKPYPIRSLIVIGGSPIQSFPNIERWHKAYEKLECLIVLDRFFTEDCKYADVIFPAASLYETARTIRGPKGMEYVPPFIDAAFEAKNDAVIMGGIAHHLGFGEGYPQSYEEFQKNLEETVSAGKWKGGPQPIEYRKYETGKLRTDTKPGFATPSGKIEIYSELLKKHGYEPLPKYKEIREIEGFDKEKWPFILATGARDEKRMGSFGANIPRLAVIEPPMVEIRPSDAETLSITTGDKIKVSTPFGERILPAKISDIAKGSLHIPHGGGSSYMSAEWEYGAANALTPLNLCDEVSGFVLIKSVPCKIEKL